jgi:uncharacterized protein (TIGR03067 family)
MRTTQTLLSWIAVAALLWGTGCSTLRAPESASVQGTWRGRELTGNTEGPRYIMISGRTFEFQGVNADDWCKGTFTVRKDANPCQIVGTLTECHLRQYVGKTAYAIYRLEGDTLTLTANEPGDPNVPGSFDAPGARQFVFKKEPIERDH